MDTSSTTVRISKSTKDKLRAIKEEALNVLDIDANITDDQVINFLIESEKDLVKLREEKKSGKSDRVEGAKQ